MKLTIETVSILQTERTWSEESFPREIDRIVESDEPVSLIKKLRRADVRESVLHLFAIHEPPFEFAIPFTAGQLAGDDFPRVLGLVIALQLFQLLDFIGCPGSWGRHQWNESGSGMSDEQQVSCRSSSQ